MSGKPLCLSGHSLLDGRRIGMVSDVGLKAWLVWGILVSVDQGDGDVGYGVVADIQDSMRRGLAQTLKGYGELNVCCGYTAVVDAAAAAAESDAAAAVAVDQIVAAKHIQLPAHAAASESNLVDQSH